jgi:hypothetical protein
MDGMDDPRDILKAAGVEVPDDVVLEMARAAGRGFSQYEQACDALASLARLVAKWHWIAGEAWMDGIGHNHDMEDIERRWGEHNA